MLSTMQDVPLTVTAIMRHACGVNGDRTVTSPAADGGYRTITYREVGQQAARLANALRRLGITGDERVGTFMWNNTEHLIAYLAVPAMGAVLHTLNIRLSAEQIAFIADYELLPNWILSGQALYRREDFSGIDRVDDYYGAGISTDYYLGENVVLGAEYFHERREPDAADSSFASNSFIVHVLLRM